VGVVEGVKEVASTALPKARLASPSPEEKKVAGQEASSPPPEETTGTKRTRR
jgi:hypothetical protein